MTLDIPIVDTKDLILRGYQEPDFEPFFAFAASERARFVGGPQSRHDSWRAFMASIGHWVLRGYGMWVIEHRETGRMAGRVGVIFNDGWDEPELAWHIYEGFEGRGLAYQACLAARDFAARTFGLNGLMSYIDKSNRRSLRLAERLGCICEREAQVVGKPAQLWRHPRVGEDVN